MAELTIEVVRRDGVGKEKAKKVRRAEQIPAILYGGHREPVPVSVDHKTISELIKKSEHGLRSIFLLSLAGTDQKRHAMIKDMQVNPISRKIEHIDFVRILMDEKVRVSIPIKVVGTAKGIKEGGLLDFPVRDLHVECLPGQIPDAIEVDVTELGMNDYYRISDLKVPEGVRVLDDMERVVASVHGHREEEVAPAADVQVAAEPELAVKRGKQETAT